MSRRPFGKFPNTYLVESGTYGGDGVADALQAGFKNVISIEISDHLFRHCEQRFRGNPSVRLVHGSTAKILYEKIKDIDEPITFWLDGHYSLGETGFDSEHICPLLLELDQIKQHPIKNHTILIDDRRLLRESSNGGMDGLFGITEEQVRKKLLEINPRYKISYENGYVPDDIIVARIE